MRSVYVLVFIGLFSVLSFGCGEKQPPIVEDPNWRDTTDPSNIVIPDQMKKSAPSAPKN
jgi:hypothetical protein